MQLTTAQHNTSLLSNNKSTVFKYAAKVREEDQKTKKEKK